MKDKMISELLVVVPLDTTEEEIKKKIDKKIGYDHGYYYDYEPNQDVVYYIEDKDIEKVGDILQRIRLVKSYIFDDVRPAEPEELGYKRKRPEKKS